MIKKLSVLCFIAALGTSAFAQTATIGGSEVTNKTVTKIEFPNNGEDIKVTYSDGTSSENLDLSEISISFANVVDAINFLNVDNENAPIFYYDLQGRRLQEAPAKGIFIMKKGNKVVKVLNK